ncbi:hypothetical protein MF672_050015 [Actinomadura sp. ATCC 31491]|uniref:SsgA family sporulation/cell division regulator n=1 Tax=Actinomadura luzonensis TaxID=2805427 RepID=A0ABT0GBN9_9ACTN|nr:hypothetical protein [Actinomadura luzonensis]MCK2221894.1 hypothetical protein [Actinomadura luzonensis]
MTVRARVRVRTPGLRLPMPLPTRSLMLRLGTDAEGRPWLMGMELDVPERVTLLPGEDGLVAEAEFWYDDAARHLRPSAAYPLWYGDEVGTLEVLDLRSHAGGER